MTLSEVIRIFEQKKMVKGIRFTEDRELYSVSLLSETDTTFDPNVLYFVYKGQIPEKLPPQLFIGGDDSDLEMYRDKYADTDSSVTVVRTERFGDVFNRARELIEDDVNVHVEYDMISAFHSHKNTSGLAIAYCIPADHPELFPGVRTVREWIIQKKIAAHVFNMRRGILLLGKQELFDNQKLLLSVAPDACRVKIGISKVFDDEEQLRAAYYEALDALDLGNRIWPEDQIYLFQEVGIFILLRGALERQELDRYLNPALKKVQEYDRQADTQLLHTLHVFLRENGSIKRTAEVLYLHRNTVIYRLNKIRQITGLDLDSAKSHFILLFSFAAMQVKEKFAS